MQKKFFEILVQTALTVGLIWTILELTPKSTLTVLNYIVLGDHPFRMSAKFSQFLILPSPLSATTVNVS